MLRGILALALITAFVQLASAEDTKAEKLQKLRQALRGQSDADQQSAKPRHPPPKSENIDMRARALDELRQPPDSYSGDAQPSVAVVKTTSIFAKDPVIYRGLQLGLTTQPYSPQGKVPLISLGERDLSQGQSTWMLGLEARFMPWTTRILGEHGVGFRVGAAYTRQPLKLLTPTGASLDNTVLHALESYAYLSQQWTLPRAKYWSVNADVGVLRFDSLLTSSSPLASASDNIWLAGLRLGPAYRLGNFSLQLSYERRQRVSAGWSRLAENGVVLGVLYGLR